MARFAAIALIMIVSLTVAQGQSLTGLDRARGHAMLRFTHKDVVAHYYDGRFHGVDLEKKFREADAKIDSAGTLGEMFLAIAGPLFALGDPHTVFVPPPRTLHMQYGWEMAMIGDSCFVTGVNAGSDAESRGVHPGDLVCSVDGQVPSRSTIRRIQYSLNALDPRTHVVLTLRGRDGGLRVLDVASTIVERERVVDLSGGVGGVDLFDAEYPMDEDSRLAAPRVREIGDSVIAWRLPRFDLSAHEIRATMERIHGSASLILDLRGNRGGYVPCLVTLVGYFFNRDIPLFVASSERGSDSVIARHADAWYRGRLIVLIDSRSASSSEIFARTMQLYGRGAVLGDVSGGSVMEARYHPRTMGAGNVVTYGSNISEAAITMPDGRSLECAGVRPDELILPASGDLALESDPVMARATELAGTPMEASRCGLLFSLRGR